MNKDKIIKDLKERNDKLKNQYELLEIRTNHLERQVENQKEIIKKQTEKIIPENHELHNRISKATGYIEELISDTKGIINAYNYEDKEETIERYIEDLETDIKHYEYLSNILRDEDTPKEEIQVLSRWYPPKEDKKIEKLDKEYAFQVSEDVVHGWTQNELIILDKINEIIDRLNGEDDEI